MATHQAPLSMGFSRQECWSGVPFLAHPKGASGAFVLIVTPGPFQVSSEGEGKSRSVSEPVLRSACRVEGALLLSSPRQIFTSQPRVPGAPFTALVPSVAPSPQLSLDHHGLLWCPRLSTSASVANQLPSLWVFLYSHSGERKSGCLNLFLASDAPLGVPVSGCTGFGSRGLSGPTLNCPA